MRPNLSHSLPTNPEKQRQESKSGSFKETLTKNQKNPKNQRTERQKRQQYDKACE